MQFGKAEWLKYFGNISDEPPLPSEIHDILNSPCPFWVGKKVIDSHVLVLIPNTVDEDPFNLNTLNKIIQNPKKGEKISYASYDACVRQEYGDISPLSHWILMTRDVLPNSRFKRYRDQKKILENCTEQNGNMYRLPTALEAATSILGVYFHSGVTLFSDDPWTYTRCLDLVNQNQWPISVGGFSSHGLYVHDCRFAPLHDYIGVAAVRQFYEPQ